MIAVLCPTAGRPNKCKAMIKSISDTVTNPAVSVVIGIDADEKEEYSRILDHEMPANFVKGMPTVYKWNMLAREAYNNPEIKLFMLGSDDIIFDTKDWARDIADHYNSLENKIHVYSMQDSRDEDGTPHPIVTREYIDAMGYFMVPIFLHWFIDSWTVDIAKAANCFTHMRHLSLTHDKSIDNGNPDETHLGIRRMGWHKRDKQTNDLCQHFLKLEKSRLCASMKDSHLKLHIARLGEQ